MDPVRIDSRTNNTLKFQLFLWQWCQMALTERAHFYHFGGNQLLILSQKARLPSQLLPHVPLMLYTSFLWKENPSLRTQLEHTALKLN